MSPRRAADPHSPGWVQRAEIGQLFRNIGSYPDARRAPVSRGFAPFQSFRQRAERLYGSAR